MKHRLLPLLLTLLLLSGCAAPLITSEYTVVTEHSDADVTEPSDALRAENYEELKYAILTFVESGVEHGVIHVYNYSGSVPDDVPAAAYAVWKNDPVGAYAVEFITTDCNLLVSYYEIRVDITYRHSRTELAAIEYVRGPGGAQRAIEAALDAAVPALVLRISAYCREEHRLVLRRALNREIKLLFDRKGVTIPFPQVVVHDGNGPLHPETEE